MQLVDRREVDHQIRLRDDFNLFMTLGLFAAGITATAVASLLVGMIHPVGMYVLLAVGVTGATIFGLFSIREVRRHHAHQKVLDDATLTYPLSMNLAVEQVSLGAPAISGGLKATTTTTPNTA